MRQFSKIKIQFFSYAFVSMCKCGFVFEFNLNLSDFILLYSMLFSKRICRIWFVLFFKQIWIWSRIANNHLVRKLKYSKCPVFENWIGQFSTNHSDGLTWAKMFGPRCLDFTLACYTDIETHLDTHLESSSNSQIKYGSLKESRVHLSIWSSKYDARGWMENDAQWMENFCFFGLGQQKMAIIIIILIIITQFILGIVLIQSGCHSLLLLFGACVNGSIKIKRKKSNQIPYSACCVTLYRWISGPVKGDSKFCNGLLERIIQT